MTIIDLRNYYDEKAVLHDGTIYRNGLVVQVWWKHDALGRPFDNGVEASKTLMGNGRETWTFYEQGEALRCYQSLIQYPTRRLG